MEVHCPDSSLAQPGVAGCSGVRTTAAKKRSARRSTRHRGHKHRDEDPSSEAAASAPTSFGATKTSSRYQYDDDSDADVNDDVMDESSSSTAEIIPAMEQWNEYRHRKDDERFRTPFDYGGSLDSDADSLSSYERELNKVKHFQSKSKSHKYYGNDHSNHIEDVNGNNLVDGRHQPNPERPPTSPKFDDNGKVPISLIPASTAVISSNTSGAGCSGSKPPQKPPRQSSSRGKATCNNYSGVNNSAS